MAVKKRGNVQSLLASAKQVIRKQEWTGVDDGTIGAAVKASYPKFAKSDQDAFMESLGGLHYEDTSNPGQCAIAYSANEGERSVGSRYQGCEAANPVVIDAGWTLAFPTSARNLYPYSIVWCIPVENGDSWRVNGESDCATSLTLFPKGTLQNMAAHT
ncbi:hypothetical protein V1509DRAFT_607830 [Lipomyces kononenkoae]